jgi:putative membrane protein
VTQATPRGVPDRRAPAHLDRSGSIGAVRFLIWVVVNALALGAAAWLLDGIRVTGATTEDQVITLVLVALIFGVVNAVVEPIVKLLSLPFIILTLGLFLFVINAGMLLLTGWLAQQFDLGFVVDGFWTAVLGGIIITLATWILEAVLPDGR